MSSSKAGSAFVVLLALMGATGCGPSSACKCQDDVNASIWSADDGTPLVAGYTGGDTGFVRAMSGTRLVDADFFELPLWRGWGTSVSDYFVVGGSEGSASVVHRTANRVQVWGKTDTDAPVEAARGIWGAGNDSVFAVGARGTIAHFDGVVWDAQESGAVTDLRDVWGATAGDVFAVGRAGTVLHFDGAAWSAFEVPTTADLNAVWGSSGTDVFVVGETEPEQAHQILHYDGAAWSVVHEGPGALLGVHGNGPDRVVAVGGQRAGSGVDAVVLTFDGSEWSGLSSNAGTFLWDVSVAADGQGYVAIGPRGTLEQRAF